MFLHNYAYFKTGYTRKFFISAHILFLFLSESHPVFYDLRNLSFSEKAAVCIFHIIFLFCFSRCIRYRYFYRQIILLIHEIIVEHPLIACDIAKGFDIFRIRKRNRLVRI